jgi:predicted  nucleic acid-binding Zn-ribbon protein
MRPERVRSRRELLEQELDQRTQTDTRTDTRTRSRRPLTDVERDNYTQELNRLINEANDLRDQLNDRPHLASTLRQQIQQLEQRIQAIYEIIN